VGYKLCINCDKKWVWLHFGRFFPQTHPVTLLENNVFDGKAVAIRMKPRKFLSPRKSLFVAAPQSIYFREMAATPFLYLFVA
jgi:hypothetical protein